MGWLFKAGSDRRSMIKDRSEGWERKNDDGTTIKTSCLGDRRVKRTHFGAENGPTW